MRWRRAEVTGLANDGAAAASRLSMALSQAQVSAPCQRLLRSRLYAELAVWESMQPLSVTMLAPPVGAAVLRASWRRPRAASYFQGRSRSVPEWQQSVTTWTCTPTGMRATKMRCNSSSRTKPRSRKSLGTSTSSWPSSSSPESSRTPAPWPL